MRTFGWQPTEGELQVTHIGYKHPYFYSTVHWVHTDFSYFDTNIDTFTLHSVHTDFFIFGNKHRYVLLYIGYTQVYSYLDTNKDLFTLYSVHTGFFIFGYKHIYFYSTFGTHRDLYIWIQTQTFLLYIGYTQDCLYLDTNTIFVPDKRSRILEVVLVRRLLTWVLGIWSGEGMGKGWGRGGQFTSNLRPRLTDPVTTRRVPSK